MPSPELRCLSERILQAFQLTGGSEALHGVELESSRTACSHEIRVVGMRQSERVRLCIADDGEVMPPEATGGVTFHEDRRPGSLGLGLAVARRIVEFHGGTFMLKSHGTDRGAECVFDLPATDNPATVTTQPVSAIRVSRPFSLVSVGVISQPPAPTTAQAT